MNELLIAIPARGGSKRLSRKNVAELNGLPLISHTINAAVEAGLTDQVYVCTEDEEIAEVSLRAGVKVFRIPEEMAGDEVSSTVPCLELYRWLQDSGGTIHHIFNLQPTSPLRNSEDVKNAYSQFLREDADFLVSATDIDPHYFHWALHQTTDGWEMYFKSQYLKERTMLPPVYRPNGAIKLAKARALNNLGNFFGPRLTVYKMPEERSIHVATAFDLDLCRYLKTNSHARTNY